MDSLHVYLHYIGIKRHFNSDYDYIKYKGKSTASVSSYNKRNDIYFFEKLSNNYNTKEIIPYFISNFVENKQFNITEDGRKIYKQWDKRISLMKHTFITDINKLVTISKNNNKQFKDLFIKLDGEYPPILSILMEQYITMETFIILQKLIKFKWMDTMKDFDIIMADFIPKINNYSSFIRVDIDLYGKIAYNCIESCKS